MILMTTATKSLMIQMCVPLSGVMPPLIEEAVQTQMEMVSRIQGTHFPLTKARLEIRIRTGLATILLDSGVINVPQFTENLGVEGYSVVLMLILMVGTMAMIPFPNNQVNGMILMGMDSVMSFQDMREMHV